MFSFQMALRARGNIQTLSLMAVTTNFLFQDHNYSGARLLLRLVDFWLQQSQTQFYPCCNRLLLQQTKFFIPQESTKGGLRCIFIVYVYSFRNKTVFLCIFTICGSIKTTIQSAPVTGICNIPYDAIHHQNNISIFVILSSLFQVETNYRSKVTAT